ncbi:hypothetical protein [Actinoplanes philippinensis]|uniref:hypothetical protein n=1 Tax=Actinoplanes philippinensis TaxID=35752 RepID=UPI0033FE06D8
MTSLSVFDQLTLYDFVTEFPATWLRRLASAGRPVYLPAGRRLFREDAVADRFWLLHTGEVAIGFHVPGVVTSSSSGSGPKRCSAGPGHVVAERLHVARLRLVELYACPAATS